ncbi:acyl-CoA thioesterase [Mechercharimyces sp. CAU 1602]|uniref:acyl-CoA thioesterase n=1 Tax=Mechercharimyces sp. CAU 1602 TaxID=2973933 RepID=UPI002162C0E0|nr:acyl-CoA thioesterase [Mechercharimyces sp. CAU 1602]MCS1351595.1 acyl-CoA thioesterase [Mechercharimyces sp. CAU 1602]
MTRQSVTCDRSRTIQSKIVLPPDTNYLGNVFGGKVLAFIDEVAAIAAMRHCGSMVVTASIDSVDFLTPVREGDIITLEAFVTWTGRTSMEVYCKVLNEDIRTGVQEVTTTSFLTMVAIDENGKPIQVPAVIPTTEEEEEIYRTAPNRHQKRRERKKNSFS